MLATDFGQIAGALNGQLQTVQTALTASLNGYHSGAFSTLPFVGHSLGNAAQIVTNSPNSFNTHLTNALAGLGTINSPTDSQIQNALSGLSELVGNVTVSRPGNLGSQGFEVEMRLQAAQTPASTTTKFDTGLPALPMIVADGGTINVSIGFAIELAFTYNSDNQQVAIDSSAKLTGLAAPDANHPIVDALHPLAIFVTAALPAGFTANTYVGFIQGTATPLANAANSLYLTAMVSNLTTTANVTLDGTSKLNVQYVGDFAQGAADFPAIDSYIHINWDFHSNNPAADRPVISYDNVYLQLGKFISKVVGPVFKAIQTTTKPMEPVQDILRKPLPGLSDLRHLIQPDQNVTLLDLAGVLAHNTDYGPLFDLIHNVGDIVNSIDQIQIDDNVRLPLGGFDLNNYDLRGITKAGDVHDLSLPNLTNFSINDVQGLGKNINQVIDELQTTDQAKDLTKKLVAELNNGYTIKFPIIDDPRQAIFNLLLGKESDLFTLTVDEVVHAEGGQVPSLSVFGMGVEFGGQIDVDAHLQLSYDTLGLREMLNDIASGNTSKIPDDIKDGYYVTPDSHFKLSGSLVAGVGVAIGIYSAEVGGFVSTDNSGDDPVSITFNDPNHDGKVRVTEIAAGATHTSGRLLGELGIEVRVGVKVLGHFIGLKHRFDIASVVLVDLNEPGPDNPQIPTGPILASQPDATGNIDLYIGAEAGMRQEVDKNDGDEQIIIKHIDSQPNGETVEIGILQRTLIGYEYWVTQTITGVKSISGYGDLGDLTINVLPQVTSAVHFEGGQGKAKLTYSGSGVAYLKAGDEDSELVGGSGNNTLFGGNGNDTIALGSAGNVVGGGMGDNSIVITTPMTQGGFIVGGVPGANNTLVVLAGDNTTSISATPDANNSLFDLNYQIAGAPPAPALALSQFSTVVLSTQDRATNVSVGDLSGAGVTQVFVNEPTSGATGRTVDLDARAGNGPSDLSLLPFVHTYDDPNNPLNIITDNALLLANATTGMTTYLMGMSGSDQTTIHQHGGTTLVGQLLHDDGSVTFDNSTRQAGQSETVTFSTPALASGNVILTHDNPAGDFVVDAINYPTIAFHGLATQDTATMNVAPPNLPAGANLILLDASTLVGGLTVNAQGPASAVNQVTLLKAGTRAAVTIDGGTSTTNVQFGASRLSDIQHSATVRNANLTIDDSGSLTPDVSTLSASAFRWTIPALGFSPTLSVSGLHGILTVKTGAGDQFDVEQTPPGISQLVFNNAQAGIQNAIFAVGASSPIAANGNFSIYLGWRLNLDGSVTQFDHLSGLPVSVTLNFSGSPTGDVVLDGDLDPAGANYLIDGAGNLHVLNQTVGLDVTINGFRAQDQLHLHLPGGSVHANLTQTGPATITVDGGARTTGTNPTAINDLTVDSRGGNVTMDPAGNGISVLHSFDTLYIASSLPQDNLTLNVPTQTNLTNSLTADASQLEGAWHVNVVNPLAQVLSPFGLTTIVLSAVNPLLAVFIVGTDPFPGSATYQVAQTTMNFGAGQLARIQGNVTVTKAVLNINDSTAAQPSNLSLTDTTFNNWVIPNTNLTPALHYNNLYKMLTVSAGAGDKFELDHTPASIDAIVLNNATAAQDEIYSTNWSVPITANGNWSIYLGSMLHLDGTVERIKQLVGLAIPVTLNFSGTPIDHVVLDGDSDPAGAQYAIDGNGNLHIVNRTVGLQVTINGYRAQDQVYAYFAGAAVTADLTRTGLGTFYLDGRSRLAGNHPTAADSISATVRSGNASLDPLNTYDSVLQAFNTVNVLGATPQDYFSVMQLTALKTAPRSQGRSQTDMSMWDDVGPFSAYYAVNPPPDYFVVLSTPYFQTTGHAEPRFLTGTSVQGRSLSSEQIDYYDTDLVYQGPTHTALVHVRVFPLNPSPTATDNHVNLDASQLRGALSYRAAEPDYTLAEILTADPNDNANYYGGANLVTTFGQTTVNLTKVNPELAVTITGTDPLSAAHYTKLSENLTLPSLPIVIHAAASELFVGTGSLANIQGNVAVHNLWLHEVDDRQGTAANNLILTATTLTGWATAGGVTHPTLSFDTLQGDLLLTGGPSDQFGIEDTPGSAYQTTIRNLATSGATPGVYVMAKTVMPLYVNGHFSVYVGRRLNADGTVTAIGQIANLYNSADRFAFTGGTISTSDFGAIALRNLQLFNSGRFSTDSYVLPGVPLFDYMAAGSPELALPVFFTYTGSAQGTLVFDASSEVITSADIFSFNNYVGLAANPNYPQQADLRFSKRIPNSTLSGDVLYGPNIELFDYGQRETNTFTSANKYGPTVIFDNPLNAPVHYISNPNSDTNRWDEVVIGAAAGPVDVRGLDGLTRVTVDPKYSGQFSTFYNSSGTLPGWGNNVRGTNILNTIAADVTVSHAGLTIRPDVDGSAAPGNLSPIVLTDNQITGIAGVPIHFSNLANSYTSEFSSSYLPSGQYPGLDLQLPGYGVVSATVQNTPSTVTTEIDTGATAIGGLTVLGTTGPLFLANPNYGRYFGGTRPLFTFSAGSVTIGGGTVGSMAGPITLGQDYHVTGDTTIDDRADATPRQVSFSTSTQTLQSYTINGLSPGSILVSTLIQSPHLAVYGPGGSQYKVMNGQQDARLFAGLGSTVEFTNEPGKLYLPGMTVMGARSVLIDPRSDPANGLNLNFYNGYQQIAVSPDPARPTDATDLTINYAVAGNFGNAKLDSVGNGYDALFVNSGTLNNVSYKADTTHLALSVDSLYSFPLDVLDTGSPGTVIDSGGMPLNVKGTTGPLEIHQSGRGIITLGNAGNLQGIHGSVSIVANDPAKPRLATTIDDTADAAARVVSVSQDGVGNTAIGGLTAIPVAISGSQFDLTLKGGTGSNRLIGPDLTGAWSISSANSGSLERNISFTAFASLQGGTQNDSFFFKPGGTLAGDLDGGGGTNTLAFQAGMLGGSEVIDLPNHKAPRIAGMVLNIQGSNTFPALTISTPGDLISGTYYLRERGGPVSPVTVTSSGGFGTKVYGAVGLPSGVAIDPNTGAITGFNNNDSYFAQVVVSVTDDSGTVSTNFYWQTLPGIVVTGPAIQTSNVGDMVNVPIQVSNNYGTALTFSYDPQYGAFPAGLSVNPQTGTISGTLAGDANVNSPYFIRIVASDGVHTGGTNPFTWTVLSGLTINTPPNQTSAAGSAASLPVQVSNNYGTTLTYTIIGSLPAGLSINSQTGLISGTIAAGASASSPYSFRVLASDGYHAAETTYVNWTVKSFVVSSPGNRNMPEGTPINFSLDTNLPIVNPAHTPLTFAVYFYGNSAADQSHGYIQYDSAARAIVGALPNGWITTDSRLLTIDVRVFDANTNDFQDVFFNWTPVPGFSVSNFLGDQTNQVRNLVSVNVASISNPAGHSFSVTATGLPAGLAINAGTGLISGTVADNADADSPYHVSVSVIDATYSADSASSSFQWTVLPGVTITHVANQSSQIGDQVNLAIEATSIFGQPLTYSAAGLPAGLTINSQTGLIGGTIPSGADAGSPYIVVVSATDGTHTGSVAFRWNVVPVDHSTLEAISWADPSLGSPLPNSASYLEAASSVVSADGRYVAFYSYASNLVPGDTNGRYDVFIRDRQNGTTTLVSGGISGPGNGDAFDPSVSADGRYVAFYSKATNLVSGGTNGQYQVFVRDRQTGTTTLVSTGANGQGNNSSASPTISANGRYITFYSSASNLTPEGGNGFYQTYVRDLQTGTTTLVSTGANGEGNGQSYYPSAISADGRYIAFASNSTNLALGGTNGRWQIFLRDQQTGTTRLVSSGTGGQANQDSYDVSISADGSRIAFDSSADNLVAGTSSFISNVYVSDWQSGAIALVSVDSAGQVGNSYSTDPSISASGRYVAFDSGATNLVAGDTNGHYDVFLHDLQTGITKRISGGGAAEGDSDSYYPSISADGRAVAFNSYADNLVSRFNVQNYEVYLYFNPDIADNADPLSVGNTNDSGPGSLRQAILYANSLGGSSHTITFALPAGSQAINLLTPLPAVTGPLVLALDASQHVKIQSQPGTVWLNSSTLTRTGAGTLVLVPGIEGPGTLAVDAGSRLTTGHIVQSGLVIGGTGGAPSIVTIAASDASGNPLAAATAGSESSVLPQTAPAEASSAIELIASNPFIVTTTAGSSPVPAADLRPWQSSLGSSLIANRSVSNTARFPIWESTLESARARDLVDSTDICAGLRVSGIVAGALAAPNQSTAFTPSSATAANRTAPPLHPQVVAAQFDNANRLEWMARPPASHSSLSLSDDALIPDELLAEICQEWQTRASAK